VINIAKTRRHAPSVFMRKSAKASVRRVKRKPLYSTGRQTLPACQAYRQTATHRKPQTNELL
jgi:hypothetical protein